MRRLWAPCSAGFSPSSGTSPTRWSLRSSACRRVSRRIRSTDLDTREQPVERVSRIDDQAEGDGATAREVMRATLRFNTLIFGVILGVFAGTALLVVLRSSRAARQASAGSRFF